MIFCAAAYPKAIWTSKYTTSIALIYFAKYIQKVPPDLSNMISPS